MELTLYLRTGTQQIADKSVSGKNSTLFVQYSRALEIRDSTGQRQSNY